MGNVVNIKTGDYSIHTSPFILFNSTSTITKLLRGLGQSMEDSFTQYMTSPRSSRSDISDIS
jgi:hypothetical protein